MRYRRTWAWLAIVALLLAACANEAGDSTEPSEAAESGPAAESAPPASAGADGDSFLARAEAGEFDGTTVDILTQWVEAEADNFEGNFADFEERTGIDINHEGVTDYTTVLNVRVEGDDAPDIAQIAQPGLMRSFQEDGRLISLSEFMDVDQLRTDYIESFIDLASVDGDLYGLYYKADLKSIVWYPNAAFEEAGYEIPATWDDLMALQ